MKKVFVRNNGMGWYIRHNTRGRSPLLAHRDLDRERVVPWRGDAATSLVGFLAAEARRLAREIEAA